MCNANTKHWQIRVTTGPGGVILRNNSEVFGKTRKVKAFTIGLLTNANLTYKLNPNLGVSLEYNICIVNCLELEPTITEKGLL